MEELNSGGILYLTDFIAPCGHTKQVVRDLRTNVFSNQKAKALRFKNKGDSNPKLWQLYGVEYDKQEGIEIIFSEIFVIVIVCESSIDDCSRRTIQSLRFVALA